MHAVFIILSLGVAAVTAVPTRRSTLVGGSVAVISQYPSAVALLYSSDGELFSQACGGAIITSKAIITAAHCVFGDLPIKWRARVGSSWANSGGTVHVLNKIVSHPDFNVRTTDNDVALLFSLTSFVYSNNVKPASISGRNYNLPDNEIIWAVGWGIPAPGVTSSDQLRHVQIWSINQSYCASRYANIGATVTSNMFCTGWIGNKTRDQCQGDSGGPLYHNGVLVGIASWGYDCTNMSYPGVNVRVSKVATWVQSNVL